MNVSFEGEPFKTFIWLRDAFFENISNAPEKIGRFFSRLISCLPSFNLKADSPSFADFFSQKEAPPFWTEPSPPPTLERRFNELKITFITPQLPEQRTGKFTSWALPFLASTDENEAPFNIYP